MDEAREVEERESSRALECKHVGLEYEHVGSAEEYVDSGYEHVGSTRK